MLTHADLMGALSLSLRSLVTFNSVQKSLEPCTQSTMAALPYPFLLYLFPGKNANCIKLYDGKVLVTNSTTPCYVDYCLLWIERRGNDNTFRCDTSV